MTDKTTTTTIPAGSITAGMVTAGADEVANYYDDGNDLRHREVARFVFQAMLSAAPSPAPAAPSAAQPDNLPLAKLLSLSARVEEKVNAEGGEATVSRIVALTVAAINEAAGQEGAQPAQGGSVSETSTVAMVIPYTDEDDRPDMSEWRMISIGRPGDIPDHVLDRIPAKAADILCDAINAVAPGSQPDSLTDILELRPDLGGATPEPSLREIVHGYYAAHFRDGGSAKFADEYLAALSAARAAQPVVEVVEALRIAYDRLDTIAAEDGRVGVIADLVRAYDAALRSGEVR